MTKSDLLHQDEVKDYIEKIEKVKTWIIYAATGEIEKNNEGAFEHLLNMNYLQMKLNDLLENLESQVVIFDYEKACGKFD
jgi:hypothetical protein